MLLTYCFVWPIIKTFVNGACLLTIELHSFEPPRNQKHARHCKGTRDSLTLTELPLIQVKRWLQHGPYEIEHDGECLCKNYSKGRKCESCVSGFFNLDDSCTRFVIFFKGSHSL